MLQIGNEVLVAECWEDESGAYHDEYAMVQGVTPLKLGFLDVSKEVADFLETCEFTEENCEVLDPC